ncbi:hypothetical protein EDM80_12635 [bacterium]|nr:MAG: hypothetical protein EDM80_12635 [bacterium]RIK60494.1 MAG: hypothetical protein DCC64_14550 [Planctomycetota bacterium]
MTTHRQILEEYRGYRRACIYAIVGAFALTGLQLALMPWPGALASLWLLAYVPPACYGIWRWRAPGPADRQPRSRNGQSEIGRGRIEIRDAASGDRA